MAEIEQFAMEGFALAADTVAAPAHLPGFWQGKAGDQAQQAGLSYPVGAGDTQHFARLQAKGEVAEQQAIALQAGEILGFEHGDGLNHRDGRRRHPELRRKAMANPLRHRS